MRIVAGKFRKKNLAKQPKNLKDLRPTTDKNREALFNILSNAKFIKDSEFSLNNAAILDICCGSGAVGFEAISRGAKTCFFIDNNNAHLDLVKKNAALLNVEDLVTIKNYDAKNLPKNDDFFDLIFIDPPYLQNYTAIMRSMLKNSWIKKGSLVVVEFKTTNEPDKFIAELLLDQLQLIELRTYGKTSFAFLNFKPN